MTLIVLVAVLFGGGGMLKGMAAAITPAPPSTGQVVAQACAENFSCSASTGASGEVVIKAAAQDGPCHTIVMQGCGVRGSRVVIVLEHKVQVSWNQTGIKVSACRYIEEKP